MKAAVFLDIAACSLVDIDRRFRGASCLHHQRGRLCDFGQYMLDYTKQHQSLYSPREPEISPYIV
jgi:hypothetical protein